MAWTTLEQGREYTRKYRIEHPEKYKEWFQKNRERVNARRRERYATDAEYRAEILEKGRQYRERNPEKTKQTILRWMKENPDKLRKEQNAYKRNRRKNDVGFKLLLVMKTRMYRALRGKVRKSASTEKLIGCSVEELKQYLENLWQPGMTWDNYGYRGWHIDHIRPCASYDLTDPGQQKECFHFSNLQPMWGIENMKKGAKQDGFSRN